MRIGTVEMFLEIVEIQPGSVLHEKDELLKFHFGENGAIPIQDV